MDKKRYESIMKRDFKYTLELYIFDLIIKNKIHEATPESFAVFKPESGLSNNYRKACQQYSGKFENTTIEKIDKEFNDWYKNRDLKEYKDLFYKKFTDKLEFDKFKNIFTNDHSKNKCHYCGITENDISELGDENSDKIKTKRLRTRGRSMEIDRIDPFGDYSENNIILACYWCNNAKTDEFSYFEFKKFIAPKIQEVWEIRLQRKLESPQMKNINESSK